MEHLDVIIVGAGISGISAAVHLGKACPERNVGILERRENIGGTWDLFKYPGIRSDSDMHTLGFDCRSSGFTFELLLSLDVLLLLLLELMHPLL